MTKVCFWLLELSWYCIYKECISSTKSTATIVACNTSAPSVTVVDVIVSPIKLETSNSLLNEAAAILT